MKFPLKGIARDLYGNILQIEDINIYETGTTVPAKVYAFEDDVVYNDTLPQVTTDANGFFEVFLEYTDYNTNMKFDVQIGDGFQVNGNEVFFVDSRVVITEDGSEFSNQKEFNENVDDRIINCGNF